MTEQWKAVPGYDGLYEVSDQGRVRSLDRVVMRGHRHGGVRPRKYKGRELRLLRHDCGYSMVSLYNDEGTKRYYLHALVASAFVGERPKGHEIRHLDGNPANNCLSNLAYGTSAENKHDVAFHGRRQLSVDNVKEIRSRLAAGELQRVIAETYCVDRSLVSGIKHGRNYSYV